MLKAFILSAMLVSSVSAQTFTVDGPCDVHFSPKGSATDAIVRLINGAHSSVHLLVYNFTSPGVGAALVAAKKRGVDVELVLDKSVPTERSSLLPAMLAAGIPAWVDAKHQIAHNKVVVVDGAIIETGSFNYTSNAENNNGENALICPSKSGAAVYEADFQRHKAHSTQQ